VTTPQERSSCPDSTEQGPAHGDAAYAIDQGVTYEHSRTGRSRSRRTPGTLMAREFVRTPPATRARAGRVMSVTSGTVLMTVGAVLVFAVTASSPGWLNLHIVGIILILAGVLGLAIPRLARSQGTWHRRWVASRMSQPHPAPPAAGNLIRAPGVNDGTRTLADDLLRREHDPPI
jgi:hypothetical protein